MFVGVGLGAGVSGGSVVGVGFVVALLSSIGSRKYTRKTDPKNKSTISNTVKNLTVKLL